MAVCGRPRKDAAQYLRGHGTRLRCVRRLLHGGPRTSGLSAIALILVAACASLALPATAATASTGPQTALAGQLSAPTAGGSNDYFNSDSCMSSAFCMAVGGYSQSGHLPGLSEKFSGGSWVAEPVPSPAQGVNVFANEVSCASPASCLFVGDHWAGKRGPAANLAEAWNGSSWRIVATTGPARTSYSFPRRRLLPHDQVLPCDRRSRDRPQIPRHGLHLGPWNYLAANPRSKPQPCP